MGDNGISAVYHNAEVSSLVKHSHVKAKNVGQIDGPVRSPLVRAYYHHVVVVNNQVFLLF